MLSALKSFFTPPAYQLEAHNLYVTLVDQARKPFFYNKCAVADTVDGRFDVIVLHLFIVINYLRGIDKGMDPSSAPAPLGGACRCYRPFVGRSDLAALFVRALQEAFFADMDRSVREMGVGDTGVGKRIKNMAQALYGRMQAYEEGLGDEQKMAIALKRNMYRDDQPDAAAMELLQAYVLRNIEHMKTQNCDEIINGKITFLD